MQLAFSRGKFYPILIILPKDQYKNIIVGCYDKSPNPGVGPQIHINLFLEIKKNPFLPGYHPIHLVP